MEKFRRRLLEIKRQRRISYGDLAREIGCSTSSVQLFCDGGRLTDSVMTKILAYVSKNMERNQYDRLIEQNRQLQEELNTYKSRERQIVGLCDKNSNLILEGDILQETYISDGKEYKDYTVVEWHQPSASFVMSHSQTDYTRFDDFGVDLNNYTIVGNRYSKPELLKKIEGFQ